MIRNASELDGAKKPWKTPPAGYRFVTEAEIASHKKPNDYKFYNKINSRRWHIGIDRQDAWLSKEDCAYAVPTGFVFGPVKVAIEIGGVKGTISAESAKELKRLLK